MEHRASVLFLPMMVYISKSASIYVLNKELIPEDFIEAVT